MAATRRTFGAASTTASSPPSSVSCAPASAPPRRARSPASPARITCRLRPAPPAAVHGISGNFYLDPVSGEAVVMTGPELLRSATILGSFSQRGARVVSITAKDKLRQQLGKDFAMTGREHQFFLAVRRCLPGGRARDRGRARVCRHARFPICTPWNSPCSCSRPGCGCWRSRGPTSCTCRSPITSSTSTRPASRRQTASIRPSTPCSPALTHRARSSRLPPTTA